jgi:hypothetical protein
MPTVVIGFRQQFLFPQREGSVPSHTCSNLASILSDTVTHAVNISSQLPVVVLMLSSETVIEIVTDNNYW